jgi:hypothetical protein
VLWCAVSPPGVAPFSFLQPKEAGDAAAAAAAAANGGAAAAGRLPRSFPFVFRAPYPQPPPVRYLAPRPAPRPVESSVPNGQAIVVDADKFKPPRKNQRHPSLKSTPAALVHGHESL